MEYRKRCEGDREARERAAWVRPGARRAGARPRRAGALGSPGSWEEASCGRGDSGSVSKIGCGGVGVVVETGVLVAATDSATATAPERPPWRNRAAAVPAPSGCSPDRAGSHSGPRATEGSMEGETRARTAGPSRCGWMGHRWGLETARRPAVRGRETRTGRYYSSRCWQTRPARAAVTRHRTVSGGPPAVWIGLRSPGGRLCTARRAPCPRSGGAAPGRKD